MKIIKPLVIVEDDLSMLLPNGMTLAQHMAKKIELFARKCYKSEGKMTEESYKTFLTRLFNDNHHEGIAEHRLISVTFITDRGVSHEGVRHRIAAYLQESTRYCDYAKEGTTSSGVNFILPPWIHPESNFANDKITCSHFYDDLSTLENIYIKWRKDHAWKPEQARGWLPHFTKTEYAASLDLGSWYNFLTKRTAPNAHPQIRQIAIPLLRYFQIHLPQFFNSIKIETIEEQGTYKFNHKNDWYDEAKLIINPFYAQPEFETIYQSKVS